MSKRPKIFNENLNVVEGGVSLLQGIGGKNNASLISEIALKLLDGNELEKVSSIFKMIPVLNLSEKLNSWINDNIANVERVDGLGFLTASNGDVSIIIDKKDVKGIAIPQKGKEMMSEDKLLVLAVSGDTIMMQESGYNKIRSLSFANGQILQDRFMNKITNLDLLRLNSSHISFNQYVGDEKIKYSIHTLKTFL